MSLTMARMMAVKRPLFFAWLLLAWTLSFAWSAAAQNVGEVVYVQGIASAQKTGEAVRFVQKGDALQEGDVVTTSARGYAIIQLTDGSKVTLRPDTSLALDEVRYGTQKDSLALRLIQGGMRAVTGLIAKRNPPSARVTTATATIGIRGTSFDARLCGADCAKDNAEGDRPTPAPPHQDAIVARLAVTSGDVFVVAKDGQSHSAVKGAPLLTGDSVRTGKDAYAVVAFRDQSVVTVVADSDFKLENVRFSTAKPSEDVFIVRMVKGGARALTGLLGKRNPKAVEYKIATATIGIRGTGLDGQLALDCVAGSCTESAFVHTWEGAVALQVGDRSIVVQAGQAGLFNPAADRLAVLDRIPDMFLVAPAPRPDSLKIDFNHLFGTTAIQGTPAGLYVLMREGHTELIGAGGSIDLGPGDAGYLAEGGTVPVRLSTPPRFMLLDPFPLPDQVDLNTVRLIDLLNLGGRVGDSICEM